MTGEDTPNDPWNCPMCGGSVAIRGDGRKDCNECSWTYRPTRDGNTTSEQAGLNEFNQ